MVAAKRYILSLHIERRYILITPMRSGIRECGDEMTSTVARWHRLLVDRIAGSRWLRGRAGAEAKWAHYERHARAWNASAQRHAAARDRARARAGRLHEQSRAKAEQLASHGEPRVLAGWQATLGRILGSTSSRERQGK